MIVHENVDDFFSINRGDILLLEGRRYLVSGTAREKSFGLDDEPKYWVKYAYDVSTGRKKVIKLVFFEQFEAKYGGYVIRCFRSPAKEGRALKLMRGNPHFMQGRTIAAGEAKEVRIIDYISGSTLFDKIAEFRETHHEYFHELLPLLLKLFVPCLEALGSLHGYGICHGDVRADHLILDKKTRKLRWIDLDYDFHSEEAPFALDLLGVGHLLADLVGMGERTTHNLRSNEALAAAIESLEPDDFSIIEPTRLMNWKKLYPYIPDVLNEVLMHFSAGSELCYESAEEIADDLYEAMASMPSALSEQITV